MIKFGAKMSSMDQEDVIKIMSTATLFIADTRNFTNEFYRYFSPKFTKNVLSNLTNIIDLQQ